MDYAASECKSDHNSNTKEMLSFEIAISGVILFIHKWSFTVNIEIKIINEVNYFNSVNCGDYFQENVVISTFQQ